MSAKEITEISSVLMASFESLEVHPILHSFHYIYYSSKISFILFYTYIRILDAVGTCSQIKKS